MVDLVERPFSYTVTIRAIEIYCNSDKSSAKSKHIDIKFFVIKDKFWNHIVSLIVLVLFFKITGPLIKGLSPKVFLEHIAHMGMTNHYDILILWEWIILCNRNFF